MANRVWKIFSMLLLTIVLVGGLILKTAKAEEIPSSETVINTYTGSVNGVERNIIITKRDNGTIIVYLKIGDMEPYGIWSGDLQVAPGSYGEIWIVDKHDNTISWFSYDLTPISDSITLYPIPNPDPTDFIDFVHDAESIIIKGDMAGGYRTTSGEERPLLSFNEMKAIAAPGSSVPEPRYIPKDNTANPSVPTPTPEVPSVNTPVPATDTPAPSENKPKGDSKQLKIKTEKKAKVLYEGDTFLGQYTLKKGVLNWKGPKKKGKITGVKMAGFNKKTKKLAWITKKGDGYVMSLKNGKKKKVVKKKAKRFVKSGNFVAKVKTTGKPVNLNNK